MVTFDSRIFCNPFYMLNARKYQYNAQKNKSIKMSKQ